MHLPTDTAVLHRFAFRRTYWFRTHRLQLVPGHRYVLFVSVSQIKRHSAKSASAFVADESYKRGFGVYQGNKYQPRKWTSHRWAGGDFDMSFRTTLTN